MDVRSPAISPAIRRSPRFFIPVCPAIRSMSWPSGRCPVSGALIAFETGSLERANSVLRRLKICTVGESLGGVETLVSHPATMTHAALGEEGRAKIGLTDGMVRISAGIEDAEDLLEDLQQALSVL